MIYRRIYFFIAYLIVLAISTFIFLLSIAIILTEMRILHLKSGH
jgi:hypothetical protein